MFGTDIKREFQREIFKSYSTYYSDVKLNDLFKKSLIVSLEDKYKNCVDQSEFDDLSQVVKLNRVFQLNNNQINTASLDIVNVVHGADFALTTRTAHNLAVGDSFTIANVAGFTTPINGVQVVTVVTDNSTVHFAAAFTGGAYTANTGQIISHSLSGVLKITSDYNHLLGLRAKFQRTLPYKVVDVTNTQPIKVLLDTVNNNIVSEEIVNVSGVVGNTNANGDRYVKKINRKTFGLFYDKELTDSTSGNGSFQGLPVLKRIFYNYATALISIEKINSYSEPTVEYPMFERGEKMLKIAPYNFICSEITMDYISDAVVFIDVANSVIDLEDTYNLSFIYEIINKAVQLFGAEINDQNKYVSASAEIQQEKNK